MQAATKPARRKLAFRDLDDVVRDAEGLLGTGYERAGNWTLGQCCGHLAEWMRYPMDGFPRQPLPIRAMLWVVRKVAGRKQLAKVLESGVMPAGMPTIPESVPAAGDDAAGVAKLKETVARMRAFAGEPQPSPLLGPLTRDEWVRVNLIHCGHHLSFLVPKT